MPENKRQHYVPKHSLRRFACDLGRLPEPRQINLVNISRSKIIRGASLKEQCYRDYFYSHQTAVEKNLSQLEGLFNAITSKMINSVSIADRDGWHLVLMIAFQKARTLRAEEEINDSMEKIIKLAMMNRIEEGDLRDLRIKFKGVANLNVGQSLLLAPILLDLKRFLIVNRTTNPFIISDNPVISTNWFCRSRHPERAGGFARSGLQLLMPLSPRFALYLHDSGTYEALSDRNVLTLTRAADVHALNSLQWLNAFKNIYFPPGLQDRDLLALMDVSRPYGGLIEFERMERTPDGAFLPTDKDEFSPPSEGTKSELLRVAARELPNDIRIPGVRMRRQPKYHDDGSMASPERDPSWVRIMNDFYDSHTKGKIKFNDFWSFVERHPTALNIGPWLSRAERRARARDQKQTGQNI